MHFYIISLHPRIFNLLPSFRIDLSVLDRKKCVSRLLTGNYFILCYSSTIEHCKNKGRSGQDYFSRIKQYIFKILNWIFVIVRRLIQAIWLRRRWLELHSTRSSMSTSAIWHIENTFDCWQVWVNFRVSSRVCHRTQYTQIRCAIWPIHFCTGSGKGSISMQKCFKMFTAKLPQNQSDCSLCPEDHIFFISPISFIYCLWSKYSPNFWVWMREP